MNGAQDLGGMMGFGPVIAEADEPVFHADWERQVLALTVAMGATGTWNLDQSRHARESLPPADYLSFSYYEIWLAALIRLIEANGLVTSAELAAGSSDGPAKPIKQKLTAETVTAVLAAGGPVDREVGGKPAFAPGDNIVALNMHPFSHTRLPRYVRGRPGKVHAVHGAHVFPDSNAKGLGEDPQWLYSVEFRASDLWGPEADTTLSVYVDLWEPYLEAR